MGVSLDAVAALAERATTSSPAWPATSRQSAGPRARRARRRLPDRRLDQPRTDHRRQGRLMRIFDPTST
ncbi:hypothetical protein NKG05_17760 [Oerskovia sp. M15]